MFNKKEIVVSKVNSFRDLFAWQRGMELARATYQATQEMPGEERFGLTSQMRRAAVSVPSNVAEGYARQTRPDYLKYLRIARGSLAELTTQLELAVSMNMIPHDQRLDELVREEERILQALIMSLERKARMERNRKRTHVQHPLSPLVP